MNQKSAGRYARAIWGSTALLTVVGLSLEALGDHPIAHPQDISILIGFASFVVVGGLIAARRPHNALGWILSGIGLALGLLIFSEGYALYGLRAVPRRPGALLAAWLQNWMWFPPTALIFTFPILLFPTGHLPSRRWRPVAWLGAVSIALLSIVFAFFPGPLDPVQGYRVGIENPVGIGALEDGPLALAPGILFVLVVLSALGSVLSLILRFRKSRGDERQQLKWVAYAATVMVLGALGAFVIELFAAQMVWDDFIFGVLILLFPAAIGIAVLKYRLYDIDVVINKTVVFGSLAAFITAVYVAIVVGIGALIGSGNKPNLGLSILATAIVAVAFQPVRERVQRVANRLVYGKRATPYEVLSEFSDKVAETYATEEVLPRMARTVAEGTGAAEARVWTNSDGRLVAAASWPEGAAAEAPTIELSDGALPPIPDVDKAIEVTHQGELLGALTVAKPAGEPLTPTEEKLLQDLASQAGLVMKNVGLTAELLRRLEELQASRQRLVKAQDDERRRLERDLHDGAQQHLVALKTRLSLARRMATQDATKARALLETLEDDADETLSTLRDLARGIYPPLLADQGLTAALEAQATKSPISVHVRAQGLARYTQEVESAVYFCCLEALQNVAKYAQARTAMVTLRDTTGELAFTVSDDGVGFDPSATSPGSGTQNMNDRIEALGGALTISSSPGEGTTVAGSMPARTMERVA